MAFNPTLKKSYWALVGAGVLYFCCLGLLLNGWVQRQALYAHKVNTAWWGDHGKPEGAGFLKNQVRPFHLNTTDGERLYGWHVLPITLYNKHESALTAETTGVVEPFEDTLAFKLLAGDPGARLVISFHGNAGTVAQGYRPVAYRALASADPERIHVLTIDYRGFGYSTGSPTEQGLIIDGIALISYALDVAKISPERIVIQGQSLGTAVSVAVAEHFSVERGIDFRAIVLVAAFSDLPTLMTTYAVGGVFPILSPLNPYPFLQRFFASRIQETWFTRERLDGLVRSSRALSLYLIHARNDFEIPWKHAEELFRVAANATSQRGMTARQIDSVKLRRDLGQAGWADIWKAGVGVGGTKFVRLEVVPAGGHNQVTTFPVVARAVLNGFEGVT